MNSHPENKQCNAVLHVALPTAPRAVDGSKGGLTNLYLGLNHPWWIGCMQMSTRGLWLAVCKWVRTGVRNCSGINNIAARAANLRFPNRSALYFFWGDLGREQYQSLYGVNSDGINRSVHCVHCVQRNVMKIALVEIRTHDTWAWPRAWVWCLTHRANSSDAKINGRCIFLFMPTHLPRLPTSFRFRPFFSL